MAFSCVLAAGGPEGILIPVYIDVRCPRVVKSVIDLGLGWRVGETAVRTVPARYQTSAEAALLFELLSRSGRTLPVILISEHHGFPLHPTLSAALATDLSGLAIVAEISEQASWELTRNFGREWSCFAGGIRLYWPFRNGRGDPRDHPLWTAQRLMDEAASIEEAASKIRAALRRRLFGLSAFAVEPARLFETIRRAAQEEELAHRRKLAQEHSDFQGLAESYAQEVETVRGELERERQTNRQLRQDLYNVQARVVWHDNGDITPSTESSTPTNVNEAVYNAEKVLTQYLTFGDDVTEGIQTLPSDAGPPGKIFYHLNILAELAQERRDGLLGGTMVQWLSKKGVSASGESETVRNNDSEMAKRTWHDGRERRKFELHIKTVEATSPNRCVRIYFDWDEVTHKVIVAWVGKHP